MRCDFKVSSINIPDGDTQYHSFMATSRGTYPFSSEGVSSRNPMAQTVQRVITNS